MTVTLIELGSGKKNKVVPGSVLRVEDTEGRSWFARVIEDRAKSNEESSANLVVLEMSERFGRADDDLPDFDLSVGSRPPFRCDRSAVRQPEIVVLPGVLRPSKARELYFVALNERGAWDCNGVVHRPVPTSGERCPGSILMHRGLVEMMAIYASEILAEMCP